MAPAIPLMLGLSALMGVGSLGGLRRGRKNTNEYFENAGIDGLEGYSVPLPGSRTQAGAEQAILDSLTGGAGGVTGQAAAVDYGNQTAARNEQNRLATETKNQVQTGALSQAERDIQTTSPEAISQATFDRMYAQMQDQNRAAAQGRQRQFDEASVRGGMLPGASDLYNREINDTANAAGLRDLLVSRELSNRQQEIARAQAMAQIGSAYNQQFAAANSDLMGLAEPIPLAPLGQLQDAYGLMQLSMDREDSRAMANAMQAYSNNIMNLAFSQMQSGAALRAQQQASNPFNVGGVLGPIAGLGLAATGLPGMMGPDPVTTLGLYGIGNSLGSGVGGAF